MRVLWIGGNHRRHLAFINEVGRSHALSGAIVQTREEMVPAPPEGLGDLDRGNFVRHFENRYRAERRYFGKQRPCDCPTLETDVANLSGAKSVAFVEKIRPDVVLVYGCGMIREPLFSALPRNTINLHLGLSPRYRGAATLFWPFYFMEPAYAGSTFHHIVAEPDAGDVIHQVVPELEPSDGIHDVSCKTVLASAREAVRLLDIIEKDGRWQAHAQKSTGKNFLARDFAPQHLRVIYNVFNDDMVKHYLRGDLESRRPNLVRQY